MDNELLNIEKWVQSLADRLERQKNTFKDFLVSELQKTTGLFSLVIRWGNDFYLAGDRIRSISLFYGFDHDRLLIANNLDEYQKQYRPIRS